jgi:hypothetical protein
MKTGKKNSVFSDLKQCIATNVNWGFRGANRLHLQDGIVNQERNLHETSSKKSWRTGWEEMWMKETKQRQKEAKYYTNTRK